ncbi:MAG: acyltransferase [Opitutae bacterium]|nr:acyltransferase [Opitutae bacterium]
MREGGWPVKKALDLVFLVVLFPVYALYVGLARVGGDKRVFMEFSQWLAVIPGFLGVGSRAAFYSLAMSACARDCRVEFMTTFVAPETRIGGHVYIGAMCNISLAEIGDDCLIGTGVLITSGQGQHVFSSRTTPIRLQGGEFQRVTIGRDCWIGNGVIIMADVGEGCVIAAGSVVTKPVPPYSIAAGSPARVIGERGCAPA